MDTATPSAPLSLLPDPPPLIRSFFIRHYPSSLDDVQPTVTPQMNSSPVKFECASGVCSNEREPQSDFCAEHNSAYTASKKRVREEEGCFLCGDPLGETSIYCVTHEGCIDGQVVDNANDFLGVNGARKLRRLADLLEKGEKYTRKPEQESFAAAFCELLDYATGIV
jgi:hypothetical protein